jgi:hypothetical protein
MQPAPTLSFDAEAVLKLTRVAPLWTRIAKYPSKSWPRRCCGSKLSRRSFSRPGIPRSCETPASDLLIALNERQKHGFWSRHHLISVVARVNRQLSRLHREIKEEAKRAARESVELEDEITAARQMLLDARDGGGGARGSHVGVGFDRPRQPSLREQQHFDTAFLRKLTDIKERLEATSIAHASPIERMTGAVRNFFRGSNARLRVVGERIEATATQRAVHEELLELLRENARLRTQANDFAEGMLADVFDRLDQPHL